MPNPLDVERPYRHVLAVGPGTGLLTATGYGTSRTLGVRVAPIQPAGFLAAQLSAIGRRHSCAVDASGNAYCWGRNSSFQIGDGSAIDRLTPARIEGLPPISQIEAGSNHTCALTTGGAAYCWGANDDGQLGDGSTSATRSTPVAVVGGHTFERLFLDGTVSCGLKTDDTLFCWGRAFAQNRTSPTLVGGGIALQSIVFGYGGASDGIPEVCGLRVTGTVRCWASVSDLASAPEPALFDGATYVSLAHGGAHLCAVETSGQAACWGNNTHHQLGDGTTTTRPAPVPVLPSISFTTVIANQTASCARSVAGDWYCWGRHQNVGLVRDPSTHAPDRALLGGIRFRDLRLESFGSRVCGISTFNAVYCWGENTNGELGNGTRIPQTAPPQAVALP